MKTIICTFLLLVGAIGQSFSQDKGQFWIGGNIRVVSNDWDNRQKESQYSIGPEFGYAFSDKWAIGLGLTFGQTKYEYNPDFYGFQDKKTNNTFSIAPFTRYTFLTRKTFKLFVDGGLSYGRQKQDHIDIDEENDMNAGSLTKINEYGVFISPGASLRLWRGLTLTGRINLLNASYSRSTKDYYDAEKDDEKNRNFIAGINSPFSLSSFSVGVNYCF